MKRILFAALAMLLAFAIATSSAAVASADDGTATASAKKKAKGKATQKAKCKGKKGKAARACRKANRPKPKPKTRSINGVYSDAAKGVTIQISNNGAKVKLTYRMTRPAIAERMAVFPGIRKGPNLTGAGSQPAPGGTGTSSWDLTINLQTLAYKLYVQENGLYGPIEIPYDYLDTLSGKLRKIR